MYRIVCDPNTLNSIVQNTRCTTYVLYHSTSMRRCDTFIDTSHYHTAAASIIVSIIGLPNNATVVVTNSLLLLSFFTGCRVPVSRSYSPHVSFHRRGMNAMMLFDRFMSYYNWVVVKINAITTLSVTITAAMMVDSVNRASSLHKVIGSSSSSSSLFIIVIINMIIFATIVP